MTFRLEKPYMNTDQAMNSILFTPNVTIGTRNPDDFLNVTQTNYEVSCPTDAEAPQWKLHGV